MISCSTHPRNETAADPHTVSAGGGWYGERAGHRAQSNLCATVFPVFWVKSHPDMLYSGAPTHPRTYSGLTLAQPARPCVHVAARLGRYGRHLACSSAVPNAALAGSGDATPMPSAANAVAPTRATLMTGRYASLPKNLNQFMTIVGKP